MMAQGGFLVHQVLILQPTFGFVLAATVVSVTTIMGTVGRVAFAAVGDRWAPRQIAAAMFVLEAIGLGLSALGSGAGGRRCLEPGRGGLAARRRLGRLRPHHGDHRLDPAARRRRLLRATLFGPIYGPIYLAIQIGTGLGSLVFGLSATAFGGSGRSSGSWP